MLTAFYGSPLAIHRLAIFIFQGVSKSLWISRIKEFIWCQKFLKFMHSFATICCFFPHKHFEDVVDSVEHFVFTLVPQGCRESFQGSWGAHVSHLCILLCIPRHLQMTYTTWYKVNAIRLVLILCHLEENNKEKISPCMDAVFPLFLISGWLILQMEMLWIQKLNCKIFC